MSRFHKWFLHENLTILWKTVKNSLNLPILAAEWHFSISTLSYTKKNFRYWQRTKLFHHCYGIVSWVIRLIAYKSPVLVNTKSFIPEQVKRKYQKTAIKREMMLAPVALHDCQPGSHEGLPVISILKVRVPIWCKKFCKFLLSKYHQCACTFEYIQLVLEFESAYPVTSSDGVYHLVVFHCITFTVWNYVFILWKIKYLAIYLVICLLKLLNGYIRTFFATFCA